MYGVVGLLEVPVANIGKSTAHAISDETSLKARLAIDFFMK